MMRTASIVVDAPASCRLRAANAVWWRIVLRWLALSVRRWNDDPNALRRRKRFMIGSGMMIKSPCADVVCLYACRQVWSQSC